METHTVTLSAFLLARIAEDEARARPMWELKVRQRIVGAPIEPLSWPTPDRVLAECEAKRRIVEESHPSPDAHDQWEAALLALASIYADHPDFQPEWRP